MEDRSTEVEAELVEMVWAGLCRDALRVYAEVVARLHLVVADELEYLAVNAVAAALSYDIDDAGVGAQIGHEEAIVNLKLVDRAHRKIQRGVASAASQRLQAVDDIQREVRLIAGELIATSSWPV